MERPNAWKAYDDAALAELEQLCGDYRAFISQNKTERECVTASVALAEAAGYVNLEDAVAEGRALKPGDKVYAVNHKKTLMLVNLGTAPLEEGVNILGAHIDSPRLDIKQNPLYEAGDMAYLDTHYYGGVKAYHWVATPLAIHGVVCKKDGTTVDVCVGEDATDPVFCISDLLIHLASDQMKKPASEAVDHENLDVIVGGRPVVISSEGDEDAEAPKEPVKQMLLDVLAEKYGIDEEDFLSAELEVVPAGAAREMGLDRSMILGYGQDDRVCAYTSLAAQLAVPEVERTSVCLLCDKEEIGSVGATGMTSRFFENARCSPSRASRARWRSAVASPRAACSPPTFPPGSTSSTPTASRRRMPPSWGTACASTSSRALAARAVPTTPTPSTSRSSATSWTRPAWPSRPASSAASARAAAVRSPISSLNTACR